MNAWLWVGCKSYIYLPCIGMEGTQHRGCVGGPCLHEQLAKKSGHGVRDYVRHMRWVLARYLEDVPHSYLRIEDNRVIFLLLTLRGDPV